MNASGVSTVLLLEKKALVYVEIDNWLLGALRLARSVAEVGEVGRQVFLKAVFINGFHIRLLWGNDAGAEFGPD